MSEPTPPADQTARTLLRQQDEAIREGIARDHAERARRLQEPLAKVRQLLTLVAATPASEHERQLAAALEELAKAVETMAAPVDLPRIGWPDEIAEADSEA
jgi:hypothetical protein